MCGAETVLNADLVIVRMGSLLGLGLAELLGGVY